MRWIGFFGVFLLCAALATAVCLSILGIPPIRVATWNIDERVDAFTIYPNWYGFLPPLLLAALGMILVVTWIVRRHRNSRLTS
jgi:hypothetical protein